MDSAIISGLFGLASTIIGALLHKEYMSRKRLKERLHRAEQDILFLLQVERLHCEQNRVLRQASFKTRVRNEAFSQGFTWSGSFTPGRVRAAEIRRASSMTTTVSAHLIVLGRHTLLAAASGVSWLTRKAMAGLRTSMHTVRARIGRTRSTT